MLITVMLEKAGSEQAARSVSKEGVTRGRRNRRAARAGQCSSSNNNWGTDQTEGTRWCAMDW